MLLIQNSKFIGYLKTNRNSANKNCSLMKNTEEKNEKKETLEKEKRSENIKDYNYELVANILEKEANISETPTNILDQLFRKKLNQQKTLLGDSRVMSWLSLDKEDLLEAGFEENIIDMIYKGISKLKEGIFKF